ncbi:MAG: ABC transporter ATP-binding protein [Firmicutes bacterium]|nr:ABC transporter ATP-binding protein [Bacillota bacterium]
MRILKRFISYYKPYKFLFWFDMFCALLLSAIDLVFPQILNGLTKGLFTRPGEEILRWVFWIGGGMLVLYLIRFGCQYFITTWGHIMGARMESNMRQDLFDHLQSLSFSYYDKNNTGEMMSKLLSDLFDISELAHHGPENIFISLLKIIGSFVLLMLVNVRMTLILIAVTAVMVVFSLFQNEKMRSTFMDNRKKIAKVNARVQDSLSGIRVVKSFGNEALEQEKFRRTNEQFLESKNSNYRVMGQFHAGNAFFLGILYTAVLVTGGISIANGSLTLSDLVLYVLYINIFMGPIETLINFTEMFQKGFAGFRRFLEVIDTEPEIVDAPDAAPLSDVKGEIAFHDVSFGYSNGEHVLQHVNFSIPSGKTVALVGPSGGGKTTICSLIPRFYDVTDGSITVDGSDIRGLTLQSLRAAIGIVQQDVYLFGGTIRENILYGKPDATEEELVAAAKRANIHDFILSLPQGYDTSAGERGVRLSGGQKQRIAIARVFLKNPKILILDEATSALDNESERHIQQALEQLSVGRTTLVIAHRLSTIRNADEILVINDEGIQERGTHEELLAKNGLYAEYYNMQFDGEENA